jgi:hypothetical protein
MHAQRVHMQSSMHMLHVPKFAPDDECVVWRQLKAVLDRQRCNDTSKVTKADGTSLGQQQRLLLLLLLLLLDTGPSSRCLRPCCSICSISRYCSVQPSELLL